MALLDVRDVTCGYGSVRVLQGVSMHVDQGEFVAMIGANGAGKTTLLRTISGVVRARSGEILLNERRLSGLSASQVPRHGVAHVPEGRQIFPRMTVRENLLVAAYLNRDQHRRQEQFELVLELFPRLRERLAQLGGTLSGGEQQMLALGRALMMAPTIIMLDEPSQGLAPKVVGEMYDKLSEIHRSGTTLFLIEQNAAAALKYASRAYVLERGRIALEGRSADLRDNDEVRRAYLGV